MHRSSWEREVEQILQVDWEQVGMGTGMIRRRQGMEGEYWEDVWEAMWKPSAVETPCNL